MVQRLGEVLPEITHLFLFKQSLMPLRQSVTVVNIYNPMFLVAKHQADALKVENMGIGTVVETFAKATNAHQRQDLIVNTIKASVYLTGFIMGWLIQ